MEKFSNLSRTLGPEVVQGQYGSLFLWQAGNQLGEGIYSHTPQVTRRPCELVVSGSAATKYVLQ